MENQLFVLDTSVLVHDPESLYSYRKSSVAIPLFVVMELDDLKISQRHDVASAARTASRHIAEIVEQGSLQDPGGVLDSRTNSHFFIIGQDEHFEELQNTSLSRKMDMLILGSALKAQERFKHLTVVLVTKDVNLRILADARGLKTEDYREDRVHPGEIPTGKHTLPIASLDNLQTLYGTKAEMPPWTEGVVDLTGVAPNEFVQFTAPDGESQLFRMGKASLKPISTRVPKMKFDAKNEGQQMALDLLLDPKVQLVVLMGPSGSGKTLLSLMVALHQLDKAYDKIILSKPVVPMGRDLGYLPGNEEEKMAPWMMSFYDNLDQLLTTDKKENQKKGIQEKNWEQLLHAGQVEIQPMHSIRGRSIPKAFMIFDEVQNTSPHEVRTIVSRAATGTKVVLCGDPSQIDDPFLDALSNGLVHAATVTRTSHIAGAVFLPEGVRSPLADLAASML